MKILLFFLLAIPKFISAQSPPCELVGDGHRVMDISGSRNHFCVIVQNGKVKCWGANSFGELGQGNTNAYGDHPDEMGFSLPYIKFSDSEVAVQLSAGVGNTCALFGNGKVRCWGSNSSGQLGQGDTENRGSKPGDMVSLDYIDLGTPYKVKKIVSGNRGDFFFGGAGFNCALFAGEQQLKCWGHRLGHGYPGLNNVGDEENEMGENLPFHNLGLKKVIDIMGASGITGALLDDNSIGIFGIYLTLNDGFPAYFDYGLAENVTIESSSFYDSPKNTIIASIIACVLVSEQDEQLESRYVKCYSSDNHVGQLGLGNKNEVEYGIANLGNPNAKPVELQSGEFYTCALFDNGQIKCWGQNDRGQLGYGDTEHRGDNAGEMGDNLPFVNLGDGRYAIKLAVGAKSTCALLDNGEVKCWGANDTGQLGLGDTTDRYSPSSPINIGCSDVTTSCSNPGCPDYSTCSALDSGGLSCTCNDNYINNNSPIDNRIVGPFGQCTPKFTATSLLLSPDSVKISVSLLVLDHPSMHLGVEVYKWISEISAFDKEQVAGFDDQKEKLSPLASSLVELTFKLQPQSKYQIVLYPLSTSGFFREGVYNQTLEVETNCDCYQSTANLQGQQMPETKINQEEGSVMIQFPDISRCEEHYEVFRKVVVDGTTATSYVSTLGTEFGVCSTSSSEPLMQIVDNLHSAKPGVGETFDYDIYPISSSPNYHRYDPITVQHTVQWEASLQGNVTLSGTSDPVSDETMFYQLRSYRNEVIPVCTGNELIFDESTPWDKWCRTVTSPDGSFNASFKLNHQSLNDDKEAAFRVRLENGLASESCLDPIDDCGADTATIARLKHLSFNVPVELYLVEPGNDETALVAIASGAVGGALLIVSIVVIVWKKRRKGIGGQRMDVVFTDVFDPKTSSLQCKLEP